MDGGSHGRLATAARELGQARTDEAAAAGLVAGVLDAIEQQHTPSGPRRRLGRRRSGRARTHHDDVPLLHGGDGSHLGGET